MRDSWKPIVSGGLAVLSGLSVFSGVLLAILLNWNYPPRYIVIEPENHSAHQIAEDAFVVHRVFRVTQPTEFHMTRELIREINGIVTRVELPDSYVFYAAGEHRVDRVQQLPTVKEGTYRYTNHVCWKANIIRTACVDLPVLDLKVNGIGGSRGDGTRGS